MRVFRHWVLTLATLASTGCGSGWRLEPVQPARTVDPRQQVQVWSGGDALRWHGLQLGQDSLSGLPFIAPLDCDSCRTTLPLSAVDSLRFGDPPGGFLDMIAVVLGVCALVAVLACCQSAT